MFEDDSQNYYEVLDVKADASANEIRQAYFRSKSAYGKDSAALYSLFDEHETRRVLENIEQAYLVLSNPDKRKEYDKVHGFLKNEDLLPTTKKTSGRAAGNVFSFAKSAGDGADPAQQAAKAVFGSETTNDMSTINDAGGGASQAATAQAGSEAKPHEERGSRHHDEYATPRTLEAHGAAGPPVQDYNSSMGAFNSRENRLGIVRRIDLVTTYERKPAMEEEIAQETTFRGEFLRKVRQYKGISIEELSEFTKISKTYINCIESEEFESLPSPAYLRGFVAQIAKALKLPHEKAATAYMAYYKSTVLK